MAIDCKVTFRCSCGNELNESFAGPLFNYHDYECDLCGKVYDIERPKIEENERKTSGQFSLYWQERKGLGMQLNPTELCKKYGVELIEERSHHPLEFTVTVKGGTPVSRKLAIAELKEKVSAHTLVVFKEED